MNANMLNNTEVFKPVYDKYVLNGSRVQYRNHLLTSIEFNVKRISAIKVIEQVMDLFVAGNCKLTEFNETHNKIAFKNNYWGYPAFSGQLFMNQLIGSTVDIDDLERILSVLFMVPETLEEAMAKLKKASNEIDKIYMQGVMKRMGCLPYLAGYFWQIKDPIYFPYFILLQEMFSRDLDFILKDQ